MPGPCFPWAISSHWLPTAGVLELRHRAQQEILLICIFGPNTSHQPDWDFPELCLSLRLCLPRPFFPISVIGKRTPSRTERLPITSAPSLLVLISIFSVNILYVQLYLGICFTEDINCHTYVIVFLNLGFCPWPHSFHIYIFSWNYNNSLWMLNIVKNTLFKICMKCSPIL